MGKYAKLPLTTISPLCNNPSCAYILREIDKYFDVGSPFILYGPIAAMLEHNNMSLADCVTQLAETVTCAFCVDDALDLVIEQVLQADSEEDCKYKIDTIYILLDYIDRMSKTCEMDSEEALSYTE